MTRRQKKITSVVVLLGLLGGLAWMLFPRPEPSYQGKTLSAWAEQYYTANRSVHRSGGYEAETAIRQIGPNAIPFLLEKMRARDPLVKEQLRKLLPLEWHATLHLRDDSEERRRIGASGLIMLGPDAAAAVPTLIEIALKHPDRDGRYIAVLTLRTLGPASEPAIPFLMQCLTNQDAIIRGEATMGLGAIGQQPEVSVPALIQYLETVRSSRRGNELHQAMDALSKFGTNAKASSPLFLELLNHPDESVRVYVTNCLPRIDPEAAAKAQVKSRW